ncbi:MAG: hypothetical protein KF889_05550 [Alphaproteobacteria bacterium]|nr:hypothetical protein [Alphaproteobacteria bacterium]MCW5742335.1 hypothetical protein [Alphaproteobacteria bacterium]
MAITDRVDVVVDTGAGASSAVSWGAILAGGLASAALTLILLSLGTGLGLSVISPWSDWNITAVRAATGAGIFACVVAVMASAVGGYLAGRLRTRWSGLHGNEVYFRDTAHGLLAWAFATVVSVGITGAAATHLAAGTASGLAPAATSAARDGGMASGPLDIHVDRLLRPSFAVPADAAAQPAPPPGRDAADRAEITRLFARANRARADLAPTDRTYLVQLIAARTGLPPAEAERRVGEVTEQMKQALNEARRATAHFALWLTAALLFGAFAAAWAATEGGEWRDGVRT